MRVILAVAHNTFREAVRDKVLYVIVFFGVIGLAGTEALAEMALYENERLVRDLGLAGANLVAILVAIFLGVTLLHREIDRRTIYTVLAKPIGRWQFVVGKFAGMAATLLTLCALLAGVVAILLAVQRSSFDGAMARATVLSALEVLVVVAVATLFSAWTRPFLSGLFTLGVFVLGRAAEDLGALASRAGGILGPVVRVLHLVAPNLNLLYVSGYEVEGRHVSVHGPAFVDWAYVGHAAGYAGLYIAGALAAAVLLFRKRDFV